MSDYIQAAICLTGPVWTICNGMHPVERDRHRLAAALRARPQSRFPRPG